MKISVLIPCHNEEKSIHACVESCLSQTRPFDQILVINDGSTDRSGEILALFGDKIDVLTIEKATGNKSRAQEKGLPLVTGDIFIATDGDTRLNSGFAAAMEKAFQDETVVAVSGIVKSLPYNWLTAVRAFEYIIAHYFHKLAQSYLDYIFVISGAAGAFRTKVFRDYLPFEHDTLTEDLDITYKLHKLGFKIAYTLDAISYTQDPISLPEYKNQMRRWYGGGWQSLKKHFRVIISSPNRALEMSLIYIEGILFSLFLFVLPLVNLRLAILFLLGNIAFNMIFAIAASMKEKRYDILYVPFIYPFMIYVNAFVFLEQGIREVVLNRKNLVWFHPKRVNI
ncbi:MAG TPA: glycosyltransferase family 2 protein [Candidatus Paceibacterota bacterium]|nr:glycosyltransferase family 2 protein [Candidatus Paceibacterota bacterium]